MAARRRRASSPHPNGSALPAEDPEEALQRAAATVRTADALLICSGAGMGVDSGLGTYRGRNAGVWGPLKTLCLDYSEMCDPDWFESDPRLAWAYWRYCHQAYSGAEPHAGYRLLASWGSRLPHGLFSVTTNIDGHWERVVGADRVLECHGTVHRLQQIDGDGPVWPAEEGELSALEVPEWDLAPGEAVEICTAKDGEWSPWSPALVGDDGFSIVSQEGEQLKAHGVRRPDGPDLLRVGEHCALPQCPSGDGGLARPAVLMFGDFRMNASRVERQRSAYEAWRTSLPRDARLAIVEVGAGRAIPVARDEAEQPMRAFPNATLIRINLDDFEVGKNFAGRAVSIAGLGALEALTRIDGLLGECGGGAPLC